MSAKAKIGILGASGYTGAELLRLLLRHPCAEIVLLTADRRAGKAMADVFPQFAPYALPTLTAVDAADWQSLALDLAFCALPHGTTQKVIADLLKRAPATKVVDLSADFRLADPAAYARWYGHEHAAPELQKECGLRADRSVSAKNQSGAACRQSRLLHDLRRTCAHSAAQSQGDRPRRDRHRCQIGNDRSGQGGARGHAVCGSLRRLSRLRRRPPSSHVRARSGVFACRRPRGDRQLHAASRADELRHPVDNLRARSQGVARKIFMRCC